MIVTILSLKIIDLILSVFAFATTTSHSTHNHFTVTCPGRATQSFTLRIAYPYRLNQATFPSPSCNGSAAATPVRPYGSFASPAEFYVFVGVSAMLYCFAAIGLFICCDHKYRKFEYIPIADFLITSVFTLLWLVSSAVWTQGVADIKYYADPTELFLRHVAVCRHQGVLCTNVSTGNFTSLHVSIVFGYLSMAVWGVNLLFLFKETKWFIVKSAPYIIRSPSAQPQLV